ncbi:hypothetical protein [Nostoc sp.]|uniref:hypothetical protein n=1 Tax=Nostoc sp. TaxID=1180 RepID=UPI002FF56F7E
MKQVVTRLGSSCDIEGAAIWCNDGIIRQSAIWSDLSKSAICSIANTCATNRNPYKPAPTNIYLGHCTPLSKQRSLNFCLCHTTNVD